MNKSHKKANCSSEEEWIRCKSKNHQGRFYLFNKSTGESKWVSKDKELESVACEEDCSEETDKPDSPPKVKGLKTPAQDRLKRLRNNINKEKKPKISQKQRTNSQNNNKINVKNSIDAGLKCSEKTEPTEEEEAVKNRTVDQKRASVKEQMPRFNAAVKEETQIKQEVQMKEEIAKQNKKLKVETARPSAKKESPHKYSTVRNNSRSAREKATKRNFLEQDINQTVPPGKLAKFATGASTSTGSSGIVINEPEESNSPSLGIIDKIKSFCRSTFSINSKPAASNVNEPVACKPPVAAKPVPKPILKIAKKSTNKKRKAESQCALSSPTMRNTVPLVVLLPKPIGITTPPPMHNTPKNLVIPSYEPGSANLRLERLRKSIITQPSIRNCIEDTISISTTTTISTSGACNNNFLSEDYEPMDWQSIEDESEMPVEINNINSNICTRSSVTFNYKNHEFASSSNEYYDIVNENLLRFSAEQQKTIRNATQKWLGDHYYFVIDTNILLHQITFVEDLAEMKLCDTSGTIIFIPYIVLQELDKLKIRSSSESAKVLTVRAIRYLNGKFEERNKHIYAQSASDERQHLIDITSADDSILNCCLQIKQHVENVVLLTEDVNLRNKAICNNILVSTKSDLVSKHAPSVSAVKSRKYQ